MFDRLAPHEKVGVGVHAVPAGKFASFAFNLQWEVHVCGEEGKGTPALTSVQSKIRHYQNTCNMYYLCSLRTRVGPVVILCKCRAKVVHLKSKPIRWVSVAIAKYSRSETNVTSYNIKYKGLRTTTHEYDTLVHKNTHTHMSTHAQKHAMHKTSLATCAHTHFHVRRYKVFLKI